MGATSDKIATDPSKLQLKKPGRISNKRLCKRLRQPNKERGTRVTFPRREAVRVIDRVHENEMRM